MEHQADVHPQLRLILPDAGPGCEKNGRRATWAVTTRSGRHQVPVAVLPTAKSLSAFSLKPQSDRLLGLWLLAVRRGTAVIKSSGVIMSQSDRNALVGIWKLQLIQFEFADTGESVDVYGPNPSGYLIQTGE